MSMQNGLVPWGGRRVAWSWGIPYHDMICEWWPEGTQMTKKDLCTDNLGDNIPKWYVGTTKLGLGKSKTLNPGIIGVKGAPLVT